MLNLLKLQKTLIFDIYKLPNILINYKNTDFILKIFQINIFDFNSFNIWL